MTTIAPSKNLPPVRSVLIGNRRLIIWDSFLHALDPSAPVPPDAPKTLTVQKAVEISGLSKSTIDRMIAAGQQATQAA